MGSSTLPTRLFLLYYKIQNSSLWGYPIDPLHTWFITYCIPFSGGLLYTNVSKIRTHCRIWTHHLESLKCCDERDAEGKYNVSWEISWEENFAEKSRLKLNDDIKIDFRESVCEVVYQNGLNTIKFKYRLLWWQRWIFRLCYWISSVLSYQIFLIRLQKAT